MRRVGFPAEFLGVEPGVFFPVGDPVPSVWQGRGRWNGGGALHTFVDDWRQEFFWRRPQEGRLVASLARIVTAPDFTVWNDDPQTIREYQAWRSAVVGAYWRQVGVKVLPVISFNSGAERYVRPHSTWAIRGPRPAAAGVWLDNLRRFVDAAQVGRLVLFGRAPDEVGLLGVPVEQRRLQVVVRDES